MENKFTTIKERVVQVAEKQSITKEKFFASIGMTSANFRGRARETPLNSSAIVNIITKYPETDLHWLLVGETKTGSSYVNEPPLEYKTSSKDYKEKDEIIRMLKNQIKDLKADKQDLKKLLGLAKGK
tara:strand:+ start:40271 stop:40651 length:381 start_codon:yes stop_codon:yes gene_type:complete